MTRATTAMSRLPWLEDHPRLADLIHTAPNRAGMACDERAPLEVTYRVPDAQGQVLLWSSREARHA